MTDVSSHARRELRSKAKREVHATDPTAEILCRLYSVILGKPVLRDSAAGPLVIEGVNRLFRRRVIAFLRGCGSVNPDQDVSVVLDNLAVAFLKLDREEVCKPGKPFAPLLWGFMKRLCLAHLRIEGWSRSQPLEIDPADFRRTPAEIAEQKDDLGELDQAIDELPPLLREAIRTWLEEKRTGRRRVWSTPRERATFHVRVSRAKEMLRTSLGVKDEEYQAERRKAKKRKAKKRPSMRRKTT